jgi:hypothetical protein
MGALIEAAIAVAASAGAPALEAYPVDTAVPGHTRNLFCGVASTFARHGFQVVARQKPDRPVMRKILSTSERPASTSRSARPSAPWPQPAPHPDR